MPAAVVHALDRLDQPDLRSERVAESLAAWSRVASMSPSDLSRPHNDWTEFIGPFAREHLERALLALGRRQAGPLRTEVERLDDLFETKTLNNPRADPSLPWWARRWWV
jgi:hypothetical protein